MNSSPIVIGVGNPIVDTVIQVDESFVAQLSGEKGGMVLVDAPTLESLLKSLPSGAVSTPGGSAGNTLFALAHMGVSTRFIGKTGNCDTGAFYRSCFSEAGGDSTRFKQADIPNGRCVSLVTPDGERTMRTNLGAAMELSLEEVSLDDFLGCSHAHIEGYLLHNESLIRKVLVSAKKAGCSISFDLASFEVVRSSRAILPDMLRNYVDIVFANAKEAVAFTNIDGDYPAMAEQLSKLCKIAVVKVGADGSWLAETGSVQKIQPVPTDRVVDTTGAGDLWAAGFLYGWIHGRPLKLCGDLGSILGAAIVGQQGSSLPEQSRQQVLSRYQSITKIKL